MALAVSLVALTASCGGGESSASSKSVKPASSAVVSDSVPEYVRGPEFVGTMKLSGLFYTPKQGSVVRLVDTRNIPHETVIALRCLQGLIARKDSASVFLYESESDETKRVYLESEYGVYFKESSPAELFAEFAEIISGFYIYNNGEFFNQILTIAMCEEAIPVTENALNGFVTPDSAHIPQVDYRGKWGGIAEALAAADKYIESTNPNYIYVGGEAGFLDYAYSVGAYAIGPQELAAEGGRLCLSREDAGSPMLIFAGKDFGVNSPDCAILNCADIKNTTFYASLPKPAKNYSQPSSVDRKARNGKIYYSLIFFDGGGNGISSASLESLWEKGNNSGISFGILLNPLISELSPAALARYYHLRSAGGQMLASPDGFAAITEGSSEELAAELREFQESYLKKSGILLETVTAESGINPAHYIAENSRDESSGSSAASAQSGQNDSESDTRYSLEPIGDGITSITIGSQEELTEFFDSLNPSEQAEFYALFIDISAHWEGDIWDSVKLQTELSASGTPGILENLLPGDLIKTVRGAGPRAGSH